ncbi:hypothetical protein HMPREF3191_00098 [Veillonellaceae bacterium DNF00626]|jgi:hypothetical protein|nr:hypothetical protein HMPREF3191_00098 [Veillonellaceae bacterium DNF00626]
MDMKDEPIIVGIESPDGTVKDYVQDEVIPFAGKQFAVLVSIPETEDDEEEPEILLSRIDIDDKGEEEYVPPTDEEYDAVAAIYNEM